MSYVPKQGDIVWIDFDPSRGYEINKRRPAVILSRDEYNIATHYCIVSPVTSSIKRDNPAYYELRGYKTTGQVATVQLMTLDYTKYGGREIQYIETLKETDFNQIAGRVQLNFDFNL